MNMVGERYLYSAGDKLPESTGEKLLESTGEVVQLSRGNFGLHWGMAPLGCLVFRRGTILY